MADPLAHIAEQDRSSRLARLDSLRGIAATYVVLHHLLTNQYAADLPSDAVPAAIRKLFLFGYFGVDLFFVLSGFIMAHVYLGYLSRTDDQDRFRVFAVRRAARLFPLHLLTLAALGAMSLLFASGLADTPANFVANVFSLQVFLSGSPNWNYPSWSISHELVAYAGFAALVFSFPKMMRARPILGLALSMATVCGFYLWNRFGAASDPNATMYGPQALLRSFPLFMAGVYLCALEGRIVAGRCGKTSIGILAALLLFVAVGAAGAFKFKAFCVLLAPAMLAVILYVQSPLMAALESWPLRLLGSLSYSLYMWHAVVERGAGKLIVDLRAAGFEFGALGQMGVAAACFALTLAVAYLSFTMVETPARRWLRRFERPRRPALQTTAG